MRTALGASVCVYPLDDLTLEASAGGVFRDQVLVVDRERRDACRPAPLDLELVAGGHGAAVVN